jgi:hypothetical protein
MSAQRIFFMTLAPRIFLVTSLRSMAIPFYGGVD